MKTIEEVREEMNGYGSWSDEKWTSYLMSLDDNTKEQMFLDIKDGVIVW